jgi:hypothetical protein
MLSVLTANSNATPHSLLSKRETSPSIGTEYKDGIDCQDGANNKDGIDYKAGANYKDKMGYKDGANNKDGIEYKAGANYKDKMGYKDGPPSASNQTKQENRSADSSNFLSSISRNMEQTDAGDYINVNVNAVLCVIMSQLWCQGRITHKAEWQTATGPALLGAPRFEDLH